MHFKSLVKKIPFKGENCNLFDLFLRCLLSNNKDMTIKAYHETVQHNPDVGVRFYYSKMDEPGLVPFHWHRSLEIIYVIHGELTFTLNHAMTQISDGQFIVVLSGAIHAVSNTPNKAYVLQISIDFIKNYWPEPENTTFNLDLADSDYQKIDYYFPVLGDIYDTKIPGYPFIFQATILQVLFALFTTFSEPVTTPETKTDHLKEVLSYINDHYAEQLPISELADMFSYNPNYLNKKSPCRPCNTSIRCVSLTSIKICCKRTNPSKNY